MVREKRKPNCFPFSYLLLARERLSSTGSDFWTGGKKGAQTKRIVIGDMFLSYASKKEIRKDNAELSGTLEFGCPKGMKSNFC